MWFNFNIFCWIWNINIPLSLIKSTEAAGRWLPPMMHPLAFDFISGICSWSYLPASSMKKSFLQASVQLSCTRSSFQYICPDYATQSWSDLLWWPHLLLSYLSRHLCNFSLLWCLQYIYLGYPVCRCTESVLLASCFWFDLDDELTCPILSSGNSLHSAYSALCNDVSLR